MSYRRTAWPVAVAAVTGLVAFPALAAAGPRAGGGSLPAAGYWDGFVNFWTGAIKNQNGVTLIAIGTAVVAIAIIASGKWVK